MMQDEDLGGSARRNVISQGIIRISQIYQRYLDLWTPHVISRWLFALFLLVLFILRVFISQGWYIVTYALGIYHLNLFIAFLTPKIDPAMDFDDGEGPELPTRSNEEFRPFIRRLPEFKFWYSVTKSTIVAMICTLFDCFNIPVFWPILVMYFITLFCITMKRQIKAADRSSNMRIVRTIPTIQTNDLSDAIGSRDNNSGYATNQAGDIVQMRQVIQQSGTRRVVIQKPLLNSQKTIATTIQKTVSNLQKNQGLQQKVVPSTQVIPAQKLVQNQVNALQKSGTVGPKTTNISQRMITHKTPGSFQKTVINDNANVHGQKVMNAQQNPQRIVLQKSAVQAKKLPEIKTNTVKLENLAASTSEAQIRRMCQAIGTIESIRMGEGNATIVFKTQSAAMVFHKKYQRKMLDLSLITVRLVPQSTLANKVVTATAKKS